MTLSDATQARQAAGAAKVTADTLVATDKTHEAAIQASLDSAHVQTTTDQATADTAKAAYKQSLLDEAQAIQDEITSLG